MVSFLSEQYGSGNSVPRCSTSQATQGASQYGAEFLFADSTEWMQSASRESMKWMQIYQKATETIYLPCH